MDIQKQRNPIEIYFDRVTPYHCYVFSYIFVCKIFVLYHMLNLLFLSPPISYDCIKSENATTAQKTNNDACPCKEAKWDRSVFTETMQTKYNIICERHWLVSFSQSIFYGGLLIGAMVFGILSDRYGRLFSMCLGFLVMGISGCLVTVAPEVNSFILLRTIEGAATGGCVVTSFVFVVEYFKSSHRETVTALVHIPVNIGHLSMGGISYVLRHCDHFQLAITIPLFLLAISYWFVLESPKWLLDVGKIDKCAKVMKKICKFNKIKCEENIREQLEAYYKLLHKKATSTSTKKQNILSIFKYKSVAINFVIMSYIYFVCGACFYGISQFVGKMSGDMHINIIISGSMLLPGTIISVFLLKWLPRRPYLAGTMICSGIIMLIVPVIPLHYAFGRTLLVCTCNSFYFMSFIIVFLYGVEIFPTSVRSTALGALSVLSRVGQMTAPLINILPEIIAVIIFGAMATLGALLCYFLPETKNTELPSTYEDAKETNLRHSSVLENKIRQMFHTNSQKEQET